MACRKGSVSKAWGTACLHGTTGGRVRVHTYIHTYIHTSMHACMHACIHTYIHTCIHTYIDVLWGLEVLHLVRGFLVLYNLGFAGVFGKQT